MKKLKSLYEKAILFKYLDRNKYKILFFQQILPECLTKQLIMGNLEEVDRGFGVSQS